MLCDDKRITWTERTYHYTPKRQQVIPESFFVCWGTLWHFLESIQGDLESRGWGGWGVTFKIHPRQEQENLKLGQAKDPENAWLILFVWWTPNFGKPWEPSFHHVRESQSRCWCFFFSPTLQEPWHLKRDQSYSCCTFLVLSFALTCFVTFCRYQ